jgi:hypothetical protein
MRRPGSKNSVPNSAKVRYRNLAWQAMEKNDGDWKAAYKYMRLVEPDIKLKSPREYCNRWWSRGPGNSSDANRSGRPKAVSCTAAKNAVKAFVSGAGLKGGRRSYSDYQEVIPSADV